MRTSIMLGRIQPFSRLIGAAIMPSSFTSLRSFAFQSRIPSRTLPSFNPSPLQSQLRTYKLKANTSYKLRFRKSKALQSGFIKRGYTMHGHKRTGEKHGLHLRRAGDAPLAKGYAKLVLKKLAPR